MLYEPSLMHAELLGHTFLQDKMIQQNDGLIIVHFLLFTLVKNIH